MYCIVCMWITCEFLLRTLDIMTAKVTIPIIAKLCRSFEDKLAVGDFLWADPWADMSCPQFEPYYSDHMT